MKKSHFLLCYFMVICMLLCGCSLGTSSKKPESSISSNDKFGGQSSATEVNNESSTNEEPVVEEISVPAENSSQTEDSPATQNQLSDFDSGTQHVEYNILEFDFPSNWTKKDGNGNIVYYYPSHNNGMVMLMYDTVAGSSASNAFDNIGVFLQGIAEGSDSFERTSDIVKKTNKNGVTYYKVYALMTLSGHDLNALIYITFSGDDIYAIFCANYIGSEYDSFPDFELIGDSFTMNQASSSSGASSTGSTSFGNTSSNTNKSQSSEIQPIELVEYGCTTLNGYVYYGVILKNPNTDVAIQYPSFRVTARDGDGIILGTEDQTLSIIYPGQTVGYGFLGFEVDEEPASYEVTLLPHEDYHILKKSQFTPTEMLEVINFAERDSKFVGEVNNPNNRSFNMVAVSVIFRDSEGNIVFGDTTFVSDVAASSTTPFEMYNYYDTYGYEFEFYASEW